jgi:homoserine O-acetyltransferase
MGGRRALEWAIAYPTRVGSALVLVVGAYATADQIATQLVQMRAIQSDPAWHGGDYHAFESRPVLGLGLARRIAHQTCCSELELELRFGRAAQTGEDPLAAGRFAVQSYMAHGHDGFLIEIEAVSELVRQTLADA